MTFWNELRHWPIVTLKYIEKFDSVMATARIASRIIIYCLLTEAMKDAQYGT